MENHLKKIDIVIICLFIFIDKYIHYEKKLIL